MQSQSAADTSRAILTDALVRVGRGDRPAFRRVYVLTQAKLFGVCVRICGEPTAAEDVLAEVYLTIWRQASRWTPGRSSPITWMAVIARNRSIDWRRAQKLRQVQMFQDAVDVVDPAPGPDAALHAAQTTQGLHRSLEALNSPQRMTIQSAFFGGQTYAEIAELGGVPLATVKSRVRRGLSKMRKHLSLADKLNQDHGNYESFTHVVRTGCAAESVFDNQPNLAMR